MERLCATLSGILYLVFGDLSNLDTNKAFFRIELHLEVPGDEGAHAQACHLRCVIFGIEDRQFKDRPYKILMATKIFHPLLKHVRPFFLVKFEIVTAIKDESELVVAIIQIAIQTGKRHVKLA